MFRISAPKLPLLESVTTSKVELGVGNETHELVSPVSNPPFVVRSFIGAARAMLSDAEPTRAISVVERNLVMARGDAGEQRRRKRTCSNASTGRALHTEGVSNTFRTIRALPSPPSSQASTNRMLPTERQPLRELGIGCSQARMRRVTIGMAMYVMIRTMSAVVITPTIHVGT